jgi:hypothetical protein
MPTPTYTPLANITLGSSASSVTFSSISQAYRDLVLVLQVKTNTVTSVYLRPNSDATSGNYSLVAMHGTGSAAQSSSNTSATGMQLTWYTNPDATNLFNAKASLMDFSATDKHKTALVRVDEVSEGTSAIAYRWGSTSAITSLLVTTGGADTFSTGSTFALYGIVA